MLSLMVLFHTLLTRKLLTTVRASNLLTLHTSLCVDPVHLPSGQDLATLITGELLTPLYPHMDHQPVMRFKGLLTYGTNLGLPGHRGNLIGDFSNLPGLGTLWEIFPMNKGRYLLFYPFQSPLFDYHLILCWLRYSRSCSHQLPCWTTETGETLQ